MGMTVLLLIRHATNDYVTQGRLAGWTPGVHINAQGQREADALARRLYDIPITAIYSSPLERAVDTANAVAFCQKLDVQIREELGEFRTGEWTGRLIKELDGTETWKQLQSSPVGVRLPGGETIDEVQRRMVAAVDSIIKEHANEVIAVVSHADPLKTVIAHYLGMDLNLFQRILINPASVTVFIFDDQWSPALFRLNDTDKLPSFKPPRKQKGEELETKQPADQVSGTNGAGSNGQVRSEQSES